MNAILALMGNGMRELELGLSGALNISDAMDALIGFLFINSVPPNWLKMCGQIGPTGNYNRKNLASWFLDLKERHQQLDEWAKVSKRARGGREHRAGGRAETDRTTRACALSLTARPPARPVRAARARLCPVSCLSASRLGPVRAPQLGVDLRALQPDGLRDGLPADDRTRKGAAARLDDDLDAGDDLLRRPVRRPAGGGHLRARPLHGGRQVVHRAQLRVRVGSKGKPRRERSSSAGSSGSTQARRAGCARVVLTGVVSHPSRPSPPSCRPPPPPRARRTCTR